MTPLQCFEPKNETQKNILKCAHCRIYFKIYPEKGLISHLFMWLTEILQVHQNPKKSANFSIKWLFVLKTVGETF